METKERKTFTYILVVCKLIVFAAFLWASVVMFQLGHIINGVILLFAVALWLILITIDAGL